MFPRTNDSFPLLRTKSPVYTFTAAKTLTLNPQLLYLEI